MILCGGIETMECGLVILQFTTPALSPLCLLVEPYQQVPGFQVEETFPQIEPCPSLITIDPWELDKRTRTTSPLDLRILAIQIQAGEPSSSLFDAERHLETQHTFMLIIKTFARRLTSRAVELRLLCSQ